MLWAEDFLFNIQQAERPLEHYMEEFLSVDHLRNSSIMSLPVVILITNVDVEDSNLPPICKHTAAPAHHQPASSTCSSNELAPSGPPSLNPVLHSSSLILSPEPVASSRTPATSPRSGLPAVSMASQINIMDNKDVCGYSSPVSPLVPSSSPSPLVPSSSPKPPLIPSIPPERPPEPELPPACPPEPELPPERPPEPAVPPECPPEPAVPAECPPEPAPPEGPPVPAPPERPPVSTPPKPGLPVLSWADYPLKLPDPQWPYGLCAP
ncbi:hypothetical protein M9458_053058 [Cirrhinus mrigala]|uniref:Uncharacterized protein n=1 Tax=Cirrhinus mrigala TaxID=683832 RepID=A0ABD0MRA2_CIRMR